MSYEPDISRHHRPRSSYTRSTPSRCPPLPTSISFSTRATIFFSLECSLSLSLLRSQLLIHRDTELIVSLVASLVDVGPNNEPNNSNNVEPRRRDVIQLVLRVLIGTSALPFRFRIILAARSLRLMKRQQLAASRQGHGRISPIVRR